MVAMFLTPASRQRCHLAIYHEQQAAAAQVSKFVWVRLRPLAPSQAYREKQTRAFGLASGLVLLQALEADVM
jgi:hypothetical protein